MGFGDAINAGFSNYANFSGRSVRSAYWYWTLFLVVGSVLAGVVDAAAGSETGLVGIVFNVATFLPSLAVAVRRLHDVDRSGWWLLLWFVPIVGWIILIVWHCTAGTPHANRFG